MRAHATLVRATVLQDQVAQEKYGKDFQELEGRERQSVGGTVGGSKGGEARKEQSEFMSKHALHMPSTDCSSAHLLYKLAACLVAQWYIHTCFDIQSYMMCVQFLTCTGIHPFPSC